MATLKDKTQQPLKELVAEIEAFPNTTRAALMVADGDAETVDVLGTIHSVAAILNSQKKKPAAEMEKGTAGTRWKMGRGRNAKRTYNTMGLLLKFQEAWKHKSVLLTLMQLIEDDVVRLTWQWKNLEALASEYEIPFAVAKNREIESGDSNFDVGEKWTDASPSYTRVKDAG